MSTIHEQARAEAEKRYPYRTHDTEVMRWQKRQHRVTFTDGFLAGHEAASRSRQVLAILDAQNSASRPNTAHLAQGEPSGTNGPQNGTHAT